MIIPREELAKVLRSVAVREDAEEDFWAVSDGEAVVHVSGADLAVDLRALASLIESGTVSW